jgi:C-terminal processing protease CtpA/Prc
MQNPHRAGVGLRLSPQPNGEYEVVYTQEGGPAFASGEILPGDVLLTVDGTPISSATLGARLRPALFCRRAGRRPLTDARDRRWQSLLRRR